MRNCSGGWLHRFLGDSESIIDEVSDGAPGGLALQAGGSGDGAIADVRAVGDLSEDDRGSDFPLAAVVGGRCVTAHVVG